MSETKIHFTSNGTWSGAMDMNAGDPGAAGPMTMFALSGYEQTYANYENLDGAHHILSLGVGHKALFLDDTLSPNQAAHGRLAGVDVINGNSGGQIIDLTSPTLSYGNVTINGGKDDDILMSSAGNDSIKGGAGNDYAWGGSGNDSITGGSGNDSVLGGTGNDLLFGGAGNDVIDNGAGTDQAYGGSGNDTIFAGLGNQILIGGSGSDTLDLSKLNGTADVDQGIHSVAITAGGNVYHYEIRSFETIIGTNAGTYFDTGEKGATRFFGGSGADHFHSEGGGSTITSGLGADVFDWNKKFTLISKGADTVTDFKVGTDHLDMSDFLKGQGDIKHPTYDQVVKLVDNANGTMVEVRAGGVFHDVAELVGVHHATLSDLLLH
jgi:Ca2+-binding RTX toxin-like protein